MKTMKSLKFLAIASLLMMTVALFSCGDESEDPAPAKPTSTTWEFVSAQVTPLGSSTAFTKTLGSCADTDAPTFKTISYTFNDDGTVVDKSVCGVDQKYTYVAQLVDGKPSIIDIYDLSGKTKLLYYDKIVIDETAKTVTANQQTFGTAKTIVATFKLK